MKRKLLTTLTAALIALSAWAYDVQIDGIYYKLNSEDMTASVTCGSNNYQGDITIPASVTYSNVTYSVISIGNNAFNYCTDLTSITIPNSVTTIGGSAFADCSGLTSIDIPSSVTSIGDYAFLGCSGLMSIIVEAGNTKYDSREDCNALIETATNTIIAGCQTTIIPNSVTSIGEAAFAYCSGLTSIDIPNSVNSIGDYAFEYCSGLASITISNSVTSIGYAAFAYCSGLTNITIGNSVSSIGDWAFGYCTALTSVTIPSSVTSIGEWAFGDCTALTDIYALRTDPAEYNCDVSAFYDFYYYSVHYSATLHVPAGCKETYQAIEPWSYFSNIVEEDFSSIEAPALKPASAAPTYYNLHGQRIAQPQSGQTVIVRGADGKSRKVYVE